MKKFLRNSLAASALMVAASLTANAQFTIIDEHFNSGAFATEQGWLTGETPSALGCDPASGQPAPTPAASTPITQGSVTYTLVNAGATPTCEHKSHGNANICETSGPPSGGVHGSVGYVHLGKTAGSLGYLATSALTGVTTMDITLSATGSGERRAILQKSLNGGTNWTDVRVLAPSTEANSGCIQYGITYANVAVNETGSALYRIMVYPTTDGGTDYQTIRIHDLVVRATQALSISKASWNESGISVAVDNNNLTLSSELISGSFDVIDLKGSVIAKNVLAKGSSASVIVPTSGLYIVRFISDNKMFTRKVSIN